MTTIQLNKKTKNRIKEYDNGSFDTIINKLIDDVENELPIIEIDDTPITSIRLKDDTIERLTAYKLTGESYENTILRMLLLAQTINTTSD